MKTSSIHPSTLYSSTKKIHLFLIIVEYLTIGRRNSCHRPNYSYHRRSCHSSSQTAFRICAHSVPSVLIVVKAWLAADCWACSRLSEAGTARQRGVLLLTLNVSSWFLCSPSWHSRTLGKGGLLALSVSSWFFVAVADFLVAALIAPMILFAA